MGLLKRFQWLPGFLAFSAQAATYFVAPYGSDSNDGLSTNAPWATVGHAVKRGWPVTYLQPGDTVRLRGGIYSGNTHAIDLNAELGALPGTSNAPITIAAFAGETPIVEGISAPYRGAQFKTNAWWIFDGLVWSNNYVNIELIECERMVFRNCIFERSAVADRGYAGVGITGFSSRNTFTNCLFNRWGTVRPSDCEDEGVSISFGNEASDIPCNFNLVISNRFHFGAHDHFQLNTSSNLIIGNEFINAPWIPTNASCYLIADGELNPYQMFGNRQTKPGDAGDHQYDMRNFWRGNRFFYTGPPPDDGGAFGIELGTTNSVYEGNVWAFALAAGIYLNTSGMSSHSRGNMIFNNVVYGCGLSHTYGGSRMQSYSGGLDMSTFEDRRSSNTIVNNVIWANLPYEVGPDIWTYQIMRTNYIGGIGLPNPLFAATNGIGYTYNPANLPDFRPQTNSPLIDAGAWLTYTTGSGSGTVVTVDESRFFCDGFGMIPGDRIRFSGSTNIYTVTLVDWPNDQLTITPAASWAGGELVTKEFGGNAPDMGAFETELVGSASPPPVPGPTPDPPAPGVQVELRGVMFLR